MEVEREERMSLQRSNQALAAANTERGNAELRSARDAAAALQAERDLLHQQLQRLEARVVQLQADCQRAAADADAARAQQQHYKVYVHLTYSSFIFQDLICYCTNKAP